MHLEFSLPHLGGIFQLAGQGGFHASLAAGRNINKTNRFIRTALHTFLTSFTQFGVINMGMPMHQHIDFSHHVIRAYHYTLPASLAFMSVKLNIFRLGMLMRFHRNRRSGTFMPPKGDAAGTLSMPSETTNVCRLLCT